MAIPIVVSGLGRCGSSLTMQMLHACGLRCAGKYPAFEHPNTNLTRRWISGGWLSSWDAVKIIDPQLLTIPKCEFDVIWLNRRPSSQAVSICKFGMFTSGFQYEDGQAGRVARSLLQDAPTALRKYEGRRLLALNFEEAILDTLMFCHKIAEFFPDRKLDAQKMTACVRERQNGVLVEPDMSMEWKLIEECRQRTEASR